jgi:hypothetical protein
MLTPIECKFLQGLLQDSSDRSESLSAQRFSADYSIGRSLGRRYAYTADDIERARNLLRALNLPEIAPPKGIDRSDAAIFTGQSEKSRTSAPHDHEVAFRVFNNATPTTLIGYQVADYSEVGELRPDVAIVVENFLTFKQLHRYKWVMERLVGVRSALAIYKGEKNFKKDDASRAINTLECPVWGFHDFDPAGLNYSALLKNVVEHLAPHEPLLRETTMAKKRTDLYYKQLAQYEKVLDACQHPQIASLWTLMKKMQKGLPQEWMRDL